MLSVSRRSPSSCCLLCCSCSSSCTSCGPGGKVGSVPRGPSTPGSRVCPLLSTCYSGPPAVSTPGQERQPALGLWPPTPPAPYLPHCLPAYSALHLPCSPAPAPGSAAGSPPVAGAEPPPSHSAWRRADNQVTPSSGPHPIHGPSCPAHPWRWACSSCTHRAATSFLSRASCGLSGDPVPLVSEVVCTVLRTWREGREGPEEP